MEWVGLETKQTWDFGIILFLLCIYISIKVPCFPTGWCLLQYGEDGSFRAFNVELVWGEDYPDTPPQVNLSTFYNKHM